MTERKLNKELVKRLIDDFERRLTPRRIPDPNDFDTPYDIMPIMKPRIIRPDGKDFYEHGNYGWLPDGGVELPCDLGGHVARMSARGEYPARYFDSFLKDGIPTVHKLAAELGVSDAEGERIFAGKGQPWTAHEALDLLHELMGEAEQKETT